MTDGTSTSDTNSLSDANSISDANSLSDTTSISDATALRARYREPAQPVLDKTIDHVDEGASAFIAASPLFVLATTGPSGTDASPRGGPPGFVAVLDAHRIAFGDLSGNNRLDSYTNLVEHPDVGMLFLVPGLDETLRINGRATVSVDDGLRERCAIDGRVPKVAVAVEVVECFIHCGKALRRAGAWDPSTWRAERPSPAAIITDHLQLDVDPAVVESDLEADYEATMWKPGGA